MYEFNRVTNLFDAQTTEQLKTNLYAWLEWGFMCIGGFSNVSYTTNAPHGGLLSTLTKIEVSGYASGRVWQSFRPGWVWQTDIPYSTQPREVALKYTDTSSTVHTYTLAQLNSANFRISYRDGTVYFPTSITASSVASVSAEFAFRYVNIYSSEDPWFKEFSFRDFRVDETNNPSLLTTKNRIRFPCIVIEPVYNFKSKPYELGNMNQIRDEDFLLHVFAEKPSDITMISGIISKQEDFSLKCFDKNAITFPMDFQGVLTTNTPLPYYPNWESWGEQWQTNSEAWNSSVDSRIYPSLYEQWPWKIARISNITSNNIVNFNDKLYWQIVRLNACVDGV